MMGLYLMGIVAALIVSYVAKKFIHSTEKSFFILELPTYRAPRWKNVAITMVSKAKIFVRDAGKVIIVISMILWGLSTYGPSGRMHAVAEKYGVWAEKSMYGRKYMGIERTTFLIDPEGKVTSIVTGVKPEEHATAILEALKKSGR